MWLSIQVVEILKTSIIIEALSGKEGCVDDSDSRNPSFIQKNWHRSFGWWKGVPANMSVSGTTN